MKTTIMCFISCGVGCAVRDPHHVFAYAMGVLTGIMIMVSVGLFSVGFEMERREERS